MEAATAKFLQEAGLSFNRSDLYDTALTHSSWTFERGLDKNCCNERLEFLGDAVLELVVSGYVYNLEPPLDEGHMTKLRSLLIREETLARMAKDINLGEALRVGNGEERSGGRNKASNLANAFEALLAAIYLDQGFDAVSHFLEPLLAPYFELAKMGKLRYDYKSSLQELVQAWPEAPRISYRLLSEEGPAHARIFSVELCLDDKPIASGSGSSKKEAEQAASAQALVILEK